MRSVRSLIVSVPVVELTQQGFFPTKNQRSMRTNPIASDWERVTAFGEDNEFSLNPLNTPLNKPPVYDQYSHK